MSMKRATDIESCVLAWTGRRTAEQWRSRNTADPGVVTGVVIGPDDKPVPHAIVTYQSGGGSAPHVAHADAKGHFTISKLRSDNYAVRASGNGVSSPWENVSVHSGKTKTFTLHTIYAKEIPKAYTATRTYEPNNYEALPTAALSSDSNLRSASRSDRN